MTSHFLSLNHPKMRFGEVRKAMFHIVELNFVLIFCLLKSSKSDFAKSRKSCFKWAIGIFFLLNCPKCVLDEVKKAMFKVVDRHCEETFSILSNPKCDLGEIKKAVFQVVAKRWELLICLLNSLKCDVVEIEKTMCQGLA